MRQVSVQGSNGKVVSYDGFDESLAFIRDYITLHGPFDGLWAFSQVGHPDFCCYGTNQIDSTG